MLRIGHLVVGEEMEGSGLRRWWVDRMAAQLGKCDIEMMCCTLLKDLVVGLLRVTVVRMRKVECESARLVSERYHEHERD